ncbi:hypothetical protein F0P96_11535 [Hymenobacter busanensis]|uniref:Uncharacterized protein n=1 Tax=Hymenobacter busanensis TaxID=2607656 RepID=A0A7L4ZWF9_9BACT|nr:hypothetical protein [Hymenobacter busanensis]KAA9332113.1 hypothetical protein F0P96_11535 [Hymenobacter busanensis]QHJ07548.1 hypothetical protein GUY19_09735 [Hymenobacter busanensis]
MTPKRLLLLLPLPLLASCASIYYPTPAPVPMFTQKGEFNASVQANLKENFTAQLAYAPADHVGLIANGSSLHNKTKKRYLEQDLGEFGAGYFTKFGPAQNRILEVYAGAGFGRAKREEFARGETPYQLQDGRLEKYFLQVNYTKKKKEAYTILGHDWQLRYGAAMRLSYVNLSDFRLNGVRAPGEDNIFFEPVTYTRINLFGPLKFQFMSGWNIRLKNRKYLTAGNSVSSFGFVLNLGGDGTNED